MIEHRCSVGERGGFFERLRRGTWLGHILEHVTLELQTLAGTAVRLRPRSRDVGRRASIRSSSSTRKRNWPAPAWPRPSALPGGDPRTPVRRGGRGARLRDAGPEGLPGPEHAARIVGRRGPRHSRPPAQHGSLVQLGYGARQQRILAAETDRTAAIAESIAQDKDLTRKLLRTVGVPVPEGRPVTDAEDAWAAAREIRHPGGGQAARRQPGPRRGHQSDHPRAGDQPPTRPPAKKAAASWSSASLPGPTIACWSWATKSWPPPAASRPRWSATACRTIAELVDVVNAIPRRSDDHATALSKIKLEAIALAVLAEQGFTPDFGSAGRQRGADSPQRQPEHRRHGHRRHRSRPSRGGRPGGRGGPRGGPGHRRRGRGGRATSAVRWKNKGAWSSRSTPGPACGCTWSPRPASRGRWAKRSSTACSDDRRATAASRSWPSPASTARPPPRG